MEVPGTRASYGPSPISRIMVASLVWYFLCVSTAFLLTLGPLQSLIGLRFVAILGLVLSLWTAYWILWRISHRLELTETVLRWRTVLRQGEIPVERIRTIAPTLFTPWRGNCRLIRIEPTLGASILVIEADGLADFVREVCALGPQIECFS